MAKDATALKLHTSLGAITGMVTAISDRPSLKIALYDQTFGKVVHCYLKPDQHELARSIWLKRVTVVGSIQRDPETGKPVSVRDIQRISEAAASLPRKSFRQARAAVPWTNEDEHAEIVLDRVNDAI